MSGSKRKQNQKAENLGAQGERERSKAAELAKEKRDRTIGIAAGIVGAVILIFLVLVHFGVFSTETPVLSVNGKDYSAAEVSYFYMNSYTRNMVYQYAQWGLYDYNTSLPDSAQVYQAGKEAELDADGKVITEAVEEMTYQQLFAEAAVDTLKYSSIWADEAAAAGYTLSAEAKASIDEQLTEIDLIARQNNISIGSYFAQVYGNGMDKKTFRAMAEMSLLAQEYIDSHKDTIDVTAEDIETYYSENRTSYDQVDYYIYTVSGVAPSTVDANGETVAATEAEQALAMAQAKATAQAVRDAIQSGTPFYQAVLAQDESAAEKLEDDYLHKGEVVSGSNAAIRDWLTNSARKAGDVTMVENASGNGYVVAQFESMYRDETPMGNVRHILVKPETSEFYTDEAGNEVLYVAPENPAEGYVKPETTTKPSEEQWAAAKTKIESIQAEWLANGGTEEAFVEAMNKYTEDVDAEGVPNGNVESGIYTDIYPGYMVQNFNDWMFADGRSAGDYGIVQNEGSYNGYHLIYYVSSSEPKYVSDIRTALKDEAVQADYEQKEAAATITLDEAALAKI